MHPGIIIDAVDWKARAAKIELIAAHGHKIGGARSRGGSRRRRWGNRRREGWR